VSNNAIAVEFDEKRIDAIFAELDQSQLPGAAVGIAIHGKPVYRKGFGLTNIELPFVLSPSIRMRIYSMTKHFACLAFMLLCEEGKADIDDPLGKYLPELHPVTHKVTMRQLMGHTGGLRDAHDICHLFSGTGRTVSSADLLSLYRDIDDVNFAPGTAWCYNNGGFLLLSVVIEGITGQSLEENLRGRIFEPVGMYDTLLRRIDTDFVPNSATMHMVNSVGSYEKSYLGTALAGEGGIVSTVDDMLRWLAHMDAPLVGSATTWEAMKAPHTLVNGTSTGYALGLVIDHYRGVETLSHAGGALGANSKMLKVPGAGLDVVIMVNRHDVVSGLLLNNILDACLPHLDQAKEIPSRAITGTFRSPTTGRVIQLGTSSASSPWIREGQQIACIDGGDLPIEPDDTGVLWTAGMASYMKKAITLIGDRSKPTVIRLSDFGNLDELVLVKPAEQVDVCAVAGRYRSDATNTNATISESDHGPRLNTVGRFGSAEFKLETLAEGIWRGISTSAMPWGGILSFDGGCETFRFSDLITRALPFRRCP
jgi:CubicO group peptidase (beta-lactamase class C family)